MNGILKNKKALSTVVTTLIILVVAVLLATVVTYYAINITTTRLESEDLKVTKHHIWTNSTEAQAAFVLTNVGGRDVLLDKITIRDQESNWSDVYYWFADFSISADLAYDQRINQTIPGAGETFSINWNGTGPAEAFTEAQNDIAVPSGSTLIIYLRSPDHIGVGDIGVTTRITIHSANAMYSKECNVEYIATP